MGERKASSLTIVQVFPPSWERRWTLRRSSPVMSYSGLKLSFARTSGGALGLPATGPVARVKATMTLPSGMVQAPVQQV
jgi:hypothetical protein